MSDELRTWLSQEIEQRSWSLRELARKTGLSHSIVSKTLSGERKPSADFCIKVAQVFGEAPEKVLRLAGILPALPASDDSMLQELMEIAQSMSLQNREELLKYARFRYQQEPDNKRR